MPRATPQGPEFVQYFGPILDALRDLGDTGRSKEVAERIATSLNIGDAKLNETLKNGTSRFRNQVYWARFYLSKTGHVGSLRRGIWALTDLGKRTHLGISEALALFQKVQSQFAVSENFPDTDETTAPNEEVADDQVVDDETRFSQELTRTLRSLSAEGFERFCQLVLRAVGFENVNVTGRSGDGGIDGNGTLRVNRLITDRVVFQCKRYASQISPSFIRDFRGAMQGRADRGIFIATTTFSTEAIREAAREGASRVELVDLFELINLMAELGLGVRKQTVNVVDRSFFSNFGAGPVRKAEV